MPSQTYTQEQFESYCKVKPPSALVWGISTLLPAFGLSILALLISRPLRIDGATPDPSLQLITNILTGIIFVTPFITYAWWWLAMSRFTAKKEKALGDTFRGMGWGLGTFPEIEKWPVAESSIVHDLSLKSSSQIPDYLRFNGQFETNPAQCVLLDARYFSSPTRSAFIYLHVALRNSFPHTIVDGKDGIARHDLPARVGNVERLKFEGELHKYFTVFTIKGAGKDALYVFTPDLLEQLLDYGVGFNIEVIGNSLYIFAQPRLFETSKGFASFMNLAAQLTKEFNQRSHISKGEQFRHDPDYAKRRMDVTSRFQLAQQSK